MAQLFANNAVSLLATNITAGATSIALPAGDGAKYPLPTGVDYFLMTIYQISGTSEINHEIIKVTQRTVDTLSVVQRAQEGTIARAFVQNDPIELRVTADSMKQTQSSWVSTNLSFNDAQFNNIGI